MDGRASAGRTVGILRVTLGVLVLTVLAYAYALSIRAGAANPFDYFGCFTNQTSLIMGLLLIVNGAILTFGNRSPEWLTVARGVWTAYLIIVAVIYNTLVPGTGSAPPWVSLLLHAIVPALVVADWVLIDDRPRLPWRRLWIVLPYPLVWLSVVLARGITDGWVPYGFLLPERGPVSLILHIIGLLAALLLAGGLVWVASRLSVAPSRTRRRSHHRTGVSSDHF